MSDNEALERNRENRTMRRLTSTRFKLNDNQDNNQDNEQDNKQDNEQDNKEVKKYALVDEMNHQVVNEIVPDDNNQSDKISDIVNREDSDRPIRTLRKKEALYLKDGQVKEFLMEEVHPFDYLKKQKDLCNTLALTSNNSNKKAMKEMIAKK